MSKSFEELINSKSDQDLEKYITDISKYTPVAIKAAITEMQLRGRTFTESELSDIDRVIAEKEAEEKKEIEKQSVNVWKKNQVTDPNAPEFYSKHAIYGFSIFFTVIFGAVLLALNIKENKKARWIVLAYGAVYTTFAISILSNFERNTILTMIVNMFGAWALYSFFWDRFIGKDTAYRAKSVWRPLIISIVIMIPFLAAMLYSL